MVKIVESGGPLVDVRKLIPGLSVVKRSQNQPILLRKTVAEMLKKAQQNLPHGYQLIIHAAWRSTGEQAEIRKYFTQHFQSKNPNWTEEQLKKEVLKFVAPSDGIDASGHLCGASVDLRLIKNGRHIPMISQKLSTQENALSAQKNLPNHILKNRQILSSACSKAGLTNYPQEYWHWCYGDVLWAKITGAKTAIYGVVGGPPAGGA